MITKIEGKCQYEGCDKDATHIASGRTVQGHRGHDTGLFCESHADKVSDEGAPEYGTACPNCGCQFGVN